MSENGETDMSVLHDRAGYDLSKRKVREEGKEMDIDKETVHTIIACAFTIVAAVLSAIGTWLLANYSNRKAADRTTKAIMEMFRDEIKVGIDILTAYIKSPTPMLMPNESFGTHLLSSDVIEAVLVKTKNLKVATGFSPHDFLKHLTNYYLHICVNVNQTITSGQSLPANATSQYLVPAQGVLVMVDEIIKSF